ncbi:hypothetical protein F511_29303 [Dorcoceras hygrometricum]|uniref:Uncharacterized protein n=1 Tax=Dorcoceras hygrometricum TaxID=472368 RepID=A0A2Z7CSN9_9LAMI|nr:hypothetical protein F511_29303 [Dorcoceras hygrometricum]
MRDTASRGPTTIVAPESQFRTCPSDHDSIGYPRMSASGESSTTMHRLPHASESHPIPTPDDPNRRGDEGSFLAVGNPFQTFNNKKDMTVECRLLNDIIAKSTAKARSFGCHSRTLLETFTDMNLGEFAALHPLKVLNVKSVHTYKMKNSSVVSEFVEAKHQIGDDEKMKEVKKSPQRNQHLRALGRSRCDLTPARRPLSDPHQVTAIHFTDTEENMFPQRILYSTIKNRDRIETRLWHSLRDKGVSMIPVDTTTQTANVESEVQQLIKKADGIQAGIRSLCVQQLDSQVDMLSFKNSMLNRFSTLAKDLSDTKQKLSGGIAALSSQLAEIVACLKGGDAKKGEIIQRKRYTDIFGLFSDSVQIQWKDTEFIKIHIQSVYSYRNISVQIYSV